MSTAGVFLAVRVAIQPRLLSSPATRCSPAMAAWIAFPRWPSADVSIVIWVTFVFAGLALRAANVLSRRHDPGAKRRSARPGKRAELVPGSTDPLAEPWGPGSSVSARGYWPAL